MGFWDDNKDAHDQVYNQDPDNKGSFGHELLAGAASFGAMKMFEDRQRKEGKQCPPNPRSFVPC